MKAPTQEQLNDPEWWSKSAPENATHYCPVAKLFYDDSYPIAPCCIPRPTKPEAPEWVDGFPPVGGECWLSFHGSQPSTVKITYMGDGVFCYRTPSGMEYTGTTAHADFRPIRTQAERNRDALAGLCRAKFNQHTSPTNSHLWQQIADAIIAAGWRKGDS